jgi:hypothetical protein
MPAPGPPGSPRHQQPASQPSVEAIRHDDSHDDDTSTPAKATRTPPSRAADSRGASARAQASLTASVLFAAAPLEKRAVLKTRVSSIPDAGRSSEGRDAARKPEGVGGKRIRARNSMPVDSGRGPEHTAAAKCGHILFEPAGLAGCCCGRMAELAGGFAQRERRA